MSQRGEAPHIDSSIEEAILDSQNSVRVNNEDQLRSLGAAAAQDLPGPEGARAPDSTINVDIKPSQVENIDPALVSAYERDLHGRNRSDMAAAVEAAEFSLQTSATAEERANAMAELQAAQSMLARLDAATARKNAAAEIDSKVASSVEGVASVEVPVQENSELKQEVSEPIIDLVTEEDKEPFRQKAFEAGLFPDQRVETEASMEAEPVAQERPVDRIREKYAKHLKDQKKWFGAPSPAKVEEARVEYVGAVQETLLAAVDDVKKKYTGQDVQNPEIALQFQADLLSATIAHRSAEEQTLRETMRTSEHNRALDKLRTWWKSNSKVRMAAGVALTGTAILGAATGQLWVTGLAAATRGALSGTGTFLMTEGAAQTIRKNVGETKERSSEEIQAMSLGQLERALASHTALQVDEGLKDFGVRQRGILRKRNDETGRSLQERYDTLLRETKEQQVTNMISNGASVEEIISSTIFDEVIDASRRGSILEKRIRLNKIANMKIGTAAGIAGAIAGALGISSAMRFGEHAAHALQGTHEVKEQSAQALRKALSAVNAGGENPPTTNLPFGTGTPDAIGLRAVPIDTTHASAEHLVAQPEGHPFGQATPDAIGFRPAPLDLSQPAVSHVDPHPMPELSRELPDHMIGHEAAVADAVHVAPPVEAPSGTPSGLHFLGETAQHQQPTTNTAEGLRAALHQIAEEKPSATPEFHNPFPEGIHSDIEHAKTVAAIAGNTAEHSEAVNHILTVKEGSNVWDTVGEYAKQRYPHLSIEQRTVLVDKVKDILKAQPTLLGEKITNIDQVPADLQFDIDKLGINVHQLAEQALRTPARDLQSIHEHLAGHVDHVVDQVAEQGTSQLPDAAAQTIQDIPRALRDTPIMYQGADGKLVELGSHLSSTTPDFDHSVVGSDWWNGEAQASWEKFDQARGVWMEEAPKEAYTTWLTSIRTLTMEEALRPQVLEASFASTGTNDMLVEAKMAEGLREVLRKLPLDAYSGKDSLSTILDRIGKALNQ